MQPINTDALIAFLAAATSTFMLPNSTNSSSIGLPRRSKARQSLLTKLLNWLSENTAEDFTYKLITSTAYFTALLACALIAGVAQTHG